MHYFGQGISNRIWFSEVSFQFLKDGYVRKWMSTEEWYLCRLIRLGMVPLVVVSLLRSTRPNCDKTEICKLTNRHLSILLRFVHIDFSYEGSTKTSFFSHYRRLFGKRNKHNIELQDVIDKQDIISRWVSLYRYACFGKDRPKNIRYLHHACTDVQCTLARVQYT